MGFYFRRSFPLTRGLRLNLSRSGAGISADVRGLRAGINSHGQLYSSASIPGTGIYYRRYYKLNHSDEGPAHGAGFWTGVFLPAVAVLLLAWAVLIIATR
jgi:Protein of unknown function (DUF4236)